MVDDGLAALARLARAVRSRAKARVVAITGSAGKTSTKDILAALLRPVARVVATHANLNNEIGVPLTLLEIDESTEVVVVELAMRGSGQIRDLARIALPDVGVITSHRSGPPRARGHRRGRGRRQSRAHRGAPGRHGGRPGRERLLERHVDRHAGRVITFGDPASDVHAVLTERRGASTHVLIDAFGRRATFDFNFTGEHYLHDALAALAAFVELGYRLDEARTGAAQIVFSDMRGAVSDLPGGGLVLNDAYNANPVAMTAAVDHLVAIADGRPMVAVLGDMYELGPGADTYHRAVGEYCAAAHVRAGGRRRPGARLPRGRARRALVRDRRGVPRGAAPARSRRAARCW